MTHRRLQPQHGRRRPLLPAARVEARAARARAPHAHGAARAPARGEPGLVAALDAQHELRAGRRAHEDPAARAPHLAADAHADRDADARGPGAARRLGDDRCAPPLERVPEPAALVDADADAAAPRGGSGRASAALGAQPLGAAAGGRLGERRERASASLEFDAVRLDRWRTSRVRLRRIRSRQVQSALELRRLDLDMDEPRAAAASAPS